MPRFYAAFFEPAGSKILFVMDDEVLTARLVSASGVFHEEPLDEELQIYLNELARRPAPLNLRIHTEALKIPGTLAQQWPDNPSLDRRAYKLWATVVDLVFSLTSVLHAEDIQLTLSIAEKPQITAPLPEKPGLLVSLDAAHGVLHRRLFRAYENIVPDFASYAAPEGMILLCQPQVYEFSRAPSEKTASSREKPHARHKKPLHLSPEDKSRLQAIQRASTRVTGKAKPMSARATAAARANKIPASLKVPPTAAHMRPAEHARSRSALPPQNPDARDLPPSYPVRAATTRTGKYADLAEGAKAGRIEKVKDLTRGPKRSK